MAFLDPRDTFPIFRALYRASMILGHYATNIVIEFLS